MIILYFHKLNIDIISHYVCYLYQKIILISSHKNKSLYYCFKDILTKHVHTLRLVTCKSIDTCANYSMILLQTIQSFYCLDPININNAVRNIE